ncbi:hypothetical protein ACIQ2D_09615 [Lysinibacillus sp. NPDC097287]|uniref:hypothetical protein n=1 Tax=Lysinibacillus sp. NPDC097287 TaxID=3364144 RepID=UPI00381DDEE2
MNIETYQIFTELNIVHWESIDSISEKIGEVRNTAKQYANDVIEVHQVVDFGRVTERSHRILIIFNCKRDLDNLGEKIIL